VISPSGEITSCPHNALLEILSRNHARVVPDGFLRDLPVSRQLITFLDTYITKGDEPKNPYANLIHIMYNLLL